jgi:hypothetical protein
MNQFMHKSRLIILTSAIAAILTTSVLAFAGQEVAGQELPNGLTPEQVAELQALINELSAVNEHASGTISELKTLAATPPEDWTVAQLFEMQDLMNQFIHLREITSEIIPAVEKTIAELQNNIKP